VTCLRDIDFGFPGFELPHHLDLLAGKQYFISLAYTFSSDYHFAKKIMTENNQFFSTHHLEFQKKMP
jgi:hypothetical protein